MLADISSVLLWAALLSCSAGSSLHLRKRAGVLLASQGILASVGGLVCALALRADLGASTYVLAGITGALLALAHLPVLRSGGRQALLPITAGAHFFFSSLWLAFPDLTGGSGGLLIGKPAGFDGSIGWLIAAMAGFSAWMWRDRLSMGARFRWAVLREENVRAEALGVPALRMQVLLFVWYGTANALAGAVGIRASGFLSPHAFGFSWSLAALAVVMFPSSLVTRLVTLPLIFAALRVFPRAVLPVSVGASQLIEMAFPVILFSALAIARFRAHSREVVASGRPN